jgi:hypothetical protein
MKRILVAALVLAQLPLAPLGAAAIDDAPAGGRPAMGSFAGARLSVPFGGRNAGEARLGLGIAGVAQRRLADGSIETRFADGAGIGFSQRGLHLSVAGQPVTRRLGAQEGEDQDETEKKDGPSTWAIVGMVAGGAVIAGGIGLALLVDAMNDASE